MLNVTGVHGVLVTFRRPAALDATLRRMAGQSHRLNTLTVVDNDDDPQVRELVAAHPFAADVVNYIPADENLGPAGGLAIGASAALRVANDTDWVMFFDDDNPPRTAEGIFEIVQFAEKMLRRDPGVGGVGLVGAGFDDRSGLVQRVDGEELSGPIQITYIGGGQLPCYRVSVIREIGLPNARLFFGFDDLDYGLRIRASGRRLYADGGMWSREREVYGLVDTGRSPSRRVGVVGWRDYYSTRNLVWILLSRRRPVAAMRVVARRVVAKAAYSVLRNPRVAWAHLIVGVRATFDACTGRMGRTVDPVSGGVEAASPANRGRKSHH